MSIPGGITVASDSRGDLYGDMPLRDLVAQVINALTFEHTHDATIDMQAIPVSANEEASVDREECKQRVSVRYSALSQPTPDYVQRELLVLYRGEAGSVDLAKESQGKERSIIDTASDESVRILKKEMKQKIHEWEGSFKHAMGKEAGPADKAILRPVYEVYKVAKNRITPAEGGGAASSAASSVGPSSSTGPASAPVAVKTVPQQPTQPPPSSYTAPSRQPVPVAPPTVSVAPTPPIVNAPAPAANASGSASNNANLPLARRLSLEEAATEKRKLKRKLHQFESEFERKHGRAPQREDRKEYSGEYARYAELKAMLNERA